MLSPIKFMKKSINSGKKLIESQAALDKKGFGNDEKDNNRFIGFFSYFYFR